MVFIGILKRMHQNADSAILQDCSEHFLMKEKHYQTLLNAFYISGLGPVYETIAEKLHTIMDSGLGSITDDIKGQPGEMAKEAGVDFIKGDNWYEILKNQGKKLLNPAEWKNLAFDTAKNAAKKVSIEATPWLRDNPYGSRYAGNRCRYPYNLHKANV
jgi:hypothetical protein